MSNEDQPVTAASILEMMQAMVGDITKTITNNNDSLRAEINNNNDSLKAEINSNNNNINEKFETMQSLNDASRVELLGLIAQRSTRSTRNSTRAPSRAISPTSLVSQVNAKLCSDADEQETQAAIQASLNDVRQRSRAPTMIEPPRPVYSGVVYTESQAVADTPRVPNVKPRQQAAVAPINISKTPQGNNFGPDLTWTQVLGDKEAADKFHEENVGRRQQRPKVSARDNTHAYRDSWSATHRPDDPLKTESFTRAAPECHAKLDGPLTLTKCLKFQKDILDYQNKNNMQIRHVSYLSEDTNRTNPHYLPVSASGIQGEDVSGSGVHSAACTIR